ncbi:MAG: 2-amino-4-hydroxy-6-hydroxymethyldihydropteridine diphosphokinase [Lachnospiraceae bacterium]|nr:2-amino-4-hydroxy-6-hydroxymethyldihydropteridine diphosphokinase [Lachnospiraceae bacterium]
MDYISIKNLEVFSRHGVFENGGSLGQKYAIDVRLYIDTRIAGVTDDIDNSVDYAKVCHFINAFMKGHDFKLIETSAERLAEDILIEYPAISNVHLTVKKPWAPVGLPIEEVNVTIERGWHRAFLSMGSNMGDREEYIRKAINLLKSNEKIIVEKESTIIETEPYGMSQQDKFLNSCIEIKTILTPREILIFCKNLEAMAGRVKTEHWGPRPLDIDILFYDNDVYDTENLTIPHADIKNRAFVLEPMCEIAPYFRHPIYMKTMSEMLSDLNNK